MRAALNKARAFPVMSVRVHTTWSRILMGMALTSLADFRGTLPEPFRRD